MANDKYEFDAQQTVISELEKISGEKRYLGDSVMVCCPFHDDDTPSCGIYTSVGMEIPLGFFNCLGCGAKGGWNYLAKHVGLETIEDWQAIESNTKGGKEKIGKIHYDMLENLSTKKDLLKKLGNKDSVFPWGANKEWRGYSGKLIKDCGGMYQVNTRSSEITCLFPIQIGKRWCGGVKANLEKVKGMPSYINSKGDWVKTHGLFPYNLVKNLIVKHDLDYVFVTEGPRDPLRLILERIPALAVLGTQNITERKIDFLIALGISKIYVLADNDKGGKIMRKNMRKLCKGKMKVECFKLPEDKDKKGRLIKLDPDNAPKIIMKQLRAMLRKKGHKLLPKGLY